MTRKTKPTKEEALATTEVHGQGRLRRLAERALQPVAVEPPKVDPHIERLGSIERASEALRYSMLRAEHWLSPRGTLREYARLNLKLALFLGIPTIVLTPILTLLLSTAVTWSALLAEIARNLVLIPAWLGTALLIITGIAFVWRLIFGR